VAARVEGRDHGGPQDGEGIINGGAEGPEEDGDVPAEVVEDVQGEEGFFEGGVGFVEEEGDQAGEADDDGTSG
jgi:hypothetical protein